MTLSHMILTSLFNKTTDIIFEKHVVYDNLQPLFCSGKKITQDVELYWLFTDFTLMLTIKYGDIAISFDTLNKYEKVNITHNSEILNDAENNIDFLVELERKIYDVAQNS